MIPVYNSTTVRSHFKGRSGFFTTCDNGASTVVECTAIQLEDTTACLEPGTTLVVRMNHRHQFAGYYHCEGSLHRQHGIILNSRTRTDNGSCISSRVREIWHFTGVPVGSITPIVIPAPPVQVCTTGGATYGVVENARLSNSTVESTPKGGTICAPSMPAGSCTANSYFPRCLLQ